MSAQLMQFTNRTKIRRGYSSTKSSVPNRKHTFKYYGLNPYKNFLEPRVFCTKDKDDLAKEAIMLLGAVLEEVENAGIFCVRHDGSKIAFIGECDYYFDEDTGFTETEPYIESVETTELNKDLDNQMFAVIDGRNMLDAYGLMIEIKENMWMVIDV